ncbi:hypothetical protein GQ53DRAFT_885530 [Thozetella sp. PMI_491]|nr:hypothetical protein GQ53DRAFT_885530 [Thozetella sp. PMI_491]
MANRFFAPRLMTLDCDDQFHGSCRASTAYPCNLLRTRYPASGLQRWSEKLATENDRLFDDYSPALRFTEMYDGTDRSSMGALNCTQPMFNYLCSFHQVPPSFLEAVLSFGATLHPLDYGLAAFWNDDTLLARDAHLLPVPSLGRSGRQIRHSYLLRSVEKSDSVPNWTWGIRQLGVHHSFDVVTGRSVWLTIKGNDIMNERINETASTSPNLQVGSAQSFAEAFTATLDVHITVLDWCGENWRWYINDIEEKARAIILKAKCAKIDEDPNFIPENMKQSLLRRASTFNSKTVSRSNTLVEGIQSTVASASRFIKRYSFGKTSPLEQTNNTAQAAPSVQRGMATLRDPKRRFDSLVNLDMFSFKELQELQNVMEIVQEALLVVKLNLSVLSQIRGYYSRLMKDSSIASLQNLQQECLGDLQSFLWRVEGIEQNMSTHREQLKTLLASIRDSNNLYDGILSYRSVQLNKLYAESAYESSRKMETIAHKTEEETISMASRI